MTSTPHDALFKLTFSSPRRAAELLRPLLGEAIASRIDWDSLTLVPGSFVDAALQALHADLLFSVRMDGRDVRLYLLLEHQSGADRWIALWLLRYMTNIWVDFVEQHSESPGLPPILPVVVHHGSKPWTIDPEFSTLVETIDLPALHALTPKFRFALADLNTVDSDGIRRGPGSAEFRLTLLALKEARLADSLLQLLRLSTPLLLELERDPEGKRVIQHIICYLFSVRDAAEFEGLDLRDLGLGKTSEAIMETREAYLLRKGREEGREEGREQGNRDFFLNLLRGKFGAVPPDAAARVESADVETLSRWSIRLLSADSLDEVFA